MWYVHALITLGSIVAIYVLIILFVSICKAHSNSKIKNREHAINVIMAQKYDLLIQLGNLMKENGIELPESISETLVAANYSGIKMINTQERLSIKTLLNKTFTILFEISEKNGLESSNRFITIKNSINDIDEHHRKEISLYNNEVNAYNYWNNSFFYRPIRNLFHIANKDIMN